jgi:hypothetical protein
MDTEADRIQREVNVLLKRGIIFSIVWLAGIGSLIAIMAGLKAKRLIAESKGAPRGMGGVWWCLVVGGVGVALWIPVVFIAIINNLTR